MRASISQSELEQLTDRTTGQAVNRIRTLMAERDAPAVSIEIVDRVLSVLPEQRDVAEQRFGEILKVMEAA